MLASASRFTRIIKLTIVFDSDDTISGQDLIILAQECPEMIELSLTRYVTDGFRPVSFGITDSVINKMSQKMAKLSLLSLLFRGPNMLTWQSLLSLSQNYRSLETLNISCNFSW
jgi:hypothetical protein